MKIKRLLLLVWTLSVSGRIAFAADPLTDAFQKGLLEEEANRNLDAAIQAYQSVLKQLDEQRKLAATTIFRLGECYRKLGKTNEATAQYQRIMREFPDQDVLTKLSQQNLTALGVGESKPKRPDLIDIPLPDEETAEIEKLKAIVRDSPDLINASVVAMGSPAPRLHVAASKGQLRVVKFLLEQGADVNQRSSKGETVLHWAAQGGHRTMIELLFSHGADANAQDGEGFTPLHHAVRQGYRSVAELLLSHKASVSAQARDGITPLHLAIGKKSVMEMLIAAKAEVNAEDANGQTPLHYAARAGDVESTRTLLAQGADVNVKIERGNDTGKAALGLAARLPTAAGLEMARLLLEAKADVNSTDVQAETPLHFAAMNDHLKLAELLIAHKANVNLQDKLGKTPLMYALDRGINGLIDLLLANKAEMNIRDQKGNTALAFALRPDRLDLLKSLLAKGANPDTQVWSGMLALHYTASLDQMLEWAKLLLDYGANIEAKGINNFTPLHYAAANGAERMTELLISKGADVNAKDSDGATPLHYAAANLQKGTLEILLKNKADLNMKTLNGMSAFDFVGRNSTPNSRTPPSRFGIGQYSNINPNEVSNLLLKYRAALPAPADGTPAEPTSQKKTM